MTRPIIRIAAAALALALAAPVAAQQLSLGEQFALRSHTGLAMGTAIADGLQAPSLGILTNDSSICASLTASVATQYLARRGDPAALTIAAATDALSAEAGTEALTDRAAIALIFGGQKPVEENYQLTLAALQALARANYEGAVFVHLRVWAPKFLERAAAEDAAVAAWLAAKPNLHTATIDPQEGVVLLHRVAVKDGAQASVEVMARTPMNDTWLGLFRRSI
ncbi:MAG: hypothetical protein ACK4OP_02270 [Gemmobacter sp.]